MLTNFQFLQILLNVYKMKPKLERKKKKKECYILIFIHKNLPRNFI